MFRNQKPVALVLLLLLSLPATQHVDAQPANPLTFTVLRRGGEILLGYFAGKKLDQWLGNDCLKQLEQLAAQLESEMADRRRQERAGLHKLEVELAATKSELAMLKTVLKGNPGQATLESFRQKLLSDLEKVLAVQEDHEQRIGSLEREVKELRQRLQELDRSPPPRRNRSGWSGETRPKARSGRTRRPSPSRPPRTTTSEGVTLVVHVHDHHNVLSVREVGQIRDANLGTFDVQGSQGDHGFQLKEGTGSVITLWGNGNEVQLPPALCSRVRVVKKGVGNQVKGCGRR